MRLSIRWRLTTWNALGFAVVLAAFAVLVYALTARALVQQTDRSLDTGFSLLAADASLRAEPRERFEHWIEEFREHQQLYCAVFRADGTLYDKHADLDLAAIPLPGPTGYAAARGTARTSGNERFRWAARRVSAGGAEYDVVLAASLRDTDRGLETLLLTMIVAGSVAIVVAALLAYGLARKALAPVDQIRRSADAITADRLDQRLPVENPDDELGLLSRTVNAMVARLEQSFTEARRFTADASHELRTPLTVIRTETELAVSNPPDRAGYEQLLGSILEECGRMGRLTDQLLWLAREDARVNGSVSEAVDVARLAVEVVETLRPLAEAKGVVVSAQADAMAPVVGDPGRLRQVLLNVLDNAIKYTPLGGKVGVRIENQAGWAVVAVEDTGTGIPPEDLPHVFERFYRVDKARSREMDGTGLGLSIARSIVTSHGGTIELSSVLGVRTVCTITLPGPAASE